MGDEGSDSDVSSLTTNSSRTALGKYESLRSRTSKSG